MNIYTKLANIQNKLFVPKDGFNSFGKYPYRSCEDILKTVKPILAESKCTLMLNNEMLDLNGRYYVEATATLIDLESGESVSIKAAAREEDVKKGMDGSQITGASSSYARKYALAGLFCIDNERDSDATNKGEDIVNPTKADVDRIAAEVAAAHSTAKCSIEQVVRIQELAQQKSIMMDVILKRYKVSSVTDMTPKQADNCISSLEKTVAK